MTKLAQANEILLKLEKKLKIKIKNKDLFLQALIHRSFLNENKECKLSHNERLEFLGDACIELAVSEHLYNSLNLPEGDLTNIRAILVNREHLSKVGKKLGLKNLILMSKGQAKSEGKALDIIISNTFEALVGALFIQSKYAKAKNFIIKTVVKPSLDAIVKSKLFKDPKTYFQEKAQEIYKITPEYKTLRSWGPDHAKTFEVGVYVGNELVASSTGNSKQEAERSAAFLALKKKKWL